MLTYVFIIIENGANFDICISATAGRKFVLKIYSEKLIFKYLTYLFDMSFYCLNNFYEKLLVNIKNYTLHFVV